MNLDNQKIVTISFIVFIVGIFIGYKLSNIELNNIHNKSQEIIKSLELNNSIYESKVSKSILIIDSIKKSSDSLRKAKDLEYKKIKINYDKFKKEIQNNEKDIDDIYSAQRIIDSILFSNGIEN